MTDIECLAEALQSRVVAVIADKDVILYDMGH